MSEANNNNYVNLFEDIKDKSLDFDTERLGLNDEKKEEKEVEMVRIHKDHSDKSRLAKFGNNVIEKEPM